MVAQKLHSDAVDDRLNRRFAPWHLHGGIVRSKQYRTTVIGLEDSLLSTRHSAVQARSVLADHNMCAWFTQDLNKMSVYMT